jgi:hypothetical protein
MRSKPVSRLAGGALLSSLVLASGSALANGRFPAANQIVFSPASPTTIVGRTTFGFLPSTDDGATWSWICEDALALPPDMSSDPELAITASGAVVAGTPTPFELGVSVSNDLGCNWSCSSAIGGNPVADVVLRVASPHSVLALLSSAPTGDGGFGPAQVYETTDDGATWAPHGNPIDPGDSTLDVFSIDVSKSDPTRIYVSAVRGGGTTRIASLFASADDGQTWTERTISQFDPTTEGSIYIGAVDPTDPDRVYVRSAGTFAVGISAYDTCMSSYGRSRLYVTTDGGATFTPANLPVSCQILGFALSPDGSRVYAGTYGDGLFVASRSDLVFTKTSSVHVECLATRGSELWACSDDSSGFIFGVSTDEGACFEPRLPLLENIAGPFTCAANPSGPLACEATGNASICTNAAFQALCTASFAMEDRCFFEAGAPEAGCPTGDAGAVAAGDGGATPHGRAQGNAGCGCTTAGARDATWPLSLLLASATVTVAALRRRRRA